MKMTKRVLALGLAGIMAVGAFGLTGCNGSGTSSDGYAHYDSDGTRVIKVGTWYDYYYTSDHTSIYDDPSLTLEKNGNDEEEFAEAVEYAQRKFDGLKAVEEKYNVKIQFINMTWDGTIDSLNTSILAGKNDCDIYEVAASFGISAVANGYAVNLKDILPEDSDIFTDQIVMTYMDTSAVKDGVYIFKSNAAEVGIANTYMLAYNQDIIDQYGVEDPYTLWENGQWTWDKWMEIMEDLTEQGIYGFCSGWTYLFDGLLMSNGAIVAGSQTETLDSPEVLETLNFIQEMYVDKKVAKEWNANDWNANMNAYLNGDVAFWIDACWISDSNSDDELNFDITWVPYPIGPSGDESTNARKSSSADSGYIIASTAADPEFVYNVFYDWLNWYDYDTEYRDSRLNWWHECALTEQNYDVMVYNSSPYSVDLWQSSDLGLSLMPLVTGEIGAAEFAESNKQLVQDYLDSLSK